MPGRIIILFFAISISTFSCRKGDLGDVKDYLVGTWKIYSISGFSHSGSLPPAYPKKGDDDYLELCIKGNGRYVLKQYQTNDRGRISQAQIYQQLGASIDMYVTFVSSNKVGWPPIIEGRQFITVNTNDHSLAYAGNSTYYVYHKE